MFSIITPALAFGSAAERTSVEFDILNIYLLKN
jgi:hypothetical protein